jgi:hypothetical protein
MLNVRDKSVLKRVVDATAMRYLNSGLPGHLSLGLIYARLGAYLEKVNNTSSFLFDLSSASQLLQQYTELLSKADDGSDSVDEEIDTLDDFVDLLTDSYESGDEEVVRVIDFIAFSIEDLMGEISQDPEVVKIIDKVNRDEVQPSDDESWYNEVYNWGASFLD